MRKNILNIWISTYNRTQIIENTLNKIFTYNNEDIKIDNSEYSLVAIQNWLLRN